MKRRWAFSLLWINAAVAVVIAVLIATNQISSARDLLHSAIYALVYANLTGVLGVLTIGTLVQALVRRNLPLTPVLALGIVAVSALGCLLAQTLFMATGFVVSQHFWQEYFRTLRTVLPLAVVFGMGSAVHASVLGNLRAAQEQLREKAASEERARKLAVEARLRSLESRIHPHFLFNTLNTISALIAMDPARAEQIVGRLAVLLRASLDTGNETLISLQQELTMVESYLDIERVRFGDKLRGSVNVPSELRDAKVPPMSVQTLVENAVKHGITPLNGRGEFMVTASAQNGNLQIEVRDTGPGFDMTAVLAGHGLDNLVQRLDALFGSKAHLNVLQRDGRSVVEMVLPRI